MAKVGDVINNPVTGEHITFLKTAQDTGGSLLQVELAAQPSGFPVGGAAHIHPKQEEHFKVLSGQLRVWLDSHEHNLTTGDEFIIPLGTPHYWINTGTEEVRVIVEFRPQTTGGIRFTVKQRQEKAAKDGEFAAIELPAAKPTCRFELVQDES